MNGIQKMLTATIATVDHRPTFTNCFSEACGRSFL